MATDLLHLLLQAHPWHGIDPHGARLADALTCYIEIVPSDSVKYELDKASGTLKVDRPQRFSSFCPTLYGFLPQTYCGDTLGERCAERLGRPKGSIKGDGDPLDVCILSEKTIPKGGFLLEAVPIGGLRMVDGNEADDKIIAVLAGDLVYGNARSLDAIPKAILDRLRHYFLTYKQIPGDDAKKQVEIPEIYDRAEALEVIKRSGADYVAKWGDPKERNAALTKLATEGRA